MADRSRTYLTLDGLRGIAALLVVQRHVAPLASGLTLTENFLAVDFFFVLSGFVVAHAYGDRLRRGGFMWTFAKIRAIRLYPLFLLGIALGALSTALQIATGNPGEFNSVLAPALILGVLFVPELPGVAVGFSTLDGPTWTLFPEMVANLLYGCFVRHLTPRMLGAVMLLGAVGMALARWNYGTLDAGWAPEDLPVIVARLTFSFFCGVLLQALSSNRPRWVSRWLPWIYGAALAGVLAYSPPPWLAGAYEVTAILLVFPALVWIGCHVEPVGQSRAVFSFLGKASYAVYVLHTPLAHLTTFALRHLLHVEAWKLAPWILLPFLGELLLFAWIADRFYDTPVRRWLGARLTPRRVVQISA